LRRLLALGAFGLACSSPAVVREPPRVPVPEKAAVGKMLRAVEQAARSDGRDEAVALLEQAVADDPDLWEAHYNLGVLRARRGELEAAQKQLEAAHDLAPNAEDVVSALGEVLRRRERPREAVAVLARFVTSFPAALTARQALIVAEREAGQPELALEQARELLKRQPGDPTALAQLALTHLELRQVDVAELLVSEALKSESRAAVVERTAGLIALERGDDALAFVHFAKATELDPTDTAAGLNTGTVLLRAGVYERAEKHFRTVLTVAPDLDAAKLGLAAALRGQGGRDKVAPYQAAEGLLKEILAATPGDWAAAHNLAVLYAESMDRPAEAAEQYRRFLSEAPAEHPARAKVQKWLADHSFSSQAVDPTARPQQ
jgi:tetratricopeptide (TPR) repeat protein